MKRLFLISLMIALVFGLILSSCAQQAPAPAPTPAPKPAPSPAPAPAPTPPAKAIELRLSHHSSPTGGIHETVFIPWAKKVEEVTNGRVKITIYPAETLAKTKEVPDATKAGLADIAWVVVGSHPGRFPLTSVTSLPFVNLPSGTIEGRKLGPGGVNSPILHQLYETFPEIQAEWADWKVLFLFTSEVYSLFTVNKPVRNQADLKGMKIRALGGPETEMYKLLGASPLLLSTPDMYDAMQKGVVDGTGMNWLAVRAFKYYEVLRYNTDARTLLAQFGIIMNKEKWNSLPPDIQQAMMSVSGSRGAETAGEAEFGLGSVSRAKAAIKEAGYEIKEVSLDPGEFEKWQQIAGKPMWDQWVADMKAKGLPGQKVLDEAFRLMEKYK